MGSGKSSVGKELAKLLQYQFIDLDEEIEKREKKSISAIFSESGEHHFRKTEQFVLKDIIHNNHVVIATGGGCALHENNFQIMEKEGTTVYLEAHAGTLFHRLAPVKKNRPLIASKGDIELMEYISDTLQERSPYYHQAKIKTDAGGSISDVARTIEIQLHNNS